MTTRPDYGFETRLPSIPDPRTANLADVVAAIKETLEVRVGAIGDGLDRAVTMRDLLNSGVATPFDLRNLGREGVTPFPLGTGDTDPDTPPAPDHLEATGALKYIILTWQFARGYSRLAYFEVWRSLTDVQSEAVNIGQTFAPIYADNVGPGKSYYYWVRAVSDADASPFNALSGTLGQTAIDPAYLLEVLTGQITETQLWAELGDRIDLIDGAADLAGSVNARLAAATLAINADITAALDALELELIEHGSAIVELQETDAEHAADIVTLGTRTDDAESTIVELLATTAGQATTLTSLNTRVGEAESGITTLNTTTGDQATALTALGTRTDTAEAGIVELFTTTDGYASTLTTLSSTVGDHTTSIATQATTIDGLSGQLVFKIDSNGYVSGWGLASTPVNGIPFSAVIVRSDSFAIGSPSGPGVAPSLPFIVRTTVTTINGVSVPIGAYLADAYIANGIISNAKIGNLAVDDAKIANMSVAKLIAGKLGIGEYIESTNYLAGDTGFRIHGNGNAEFSNVTVRGTVYATAGQIGGNTINSTGVQSPGYSSGVSGWRLNSDGSAQFNNMSFRGTLDGPSGTLGIITAAIIQSGTSGARTVTTEKGAIVYDATNTRRFQWGDLSV